MKKIFAILLTLILSLTAIPAFADESTIQYYNYHFDTSNLTSSSVPTDIVLYTEGGQNDYNFTPQYALVKFSDVSSSVNPTVYVTLLNYVYNNSGSNYNAPLVYSRPAFVDSLLISLGNFTSGEKLTFSNFANCSTGGQNPCAKILNGDFKVDITLYSSDPSNVPELPSGCPEPEPCPDPDEPFIVGLFRDGFWGVATAVVALIVPIVALFLVFRLIHDFFWGRG